MLRIDLTPIAAQPGVVSALFIGSGQPIAACGRHIADAAIQSVLVEAMVSAAHALGERTEIGGCVELASTHAGGGLMLFAGPAGYQLMVRCTPSVDLAALRPMADALLRAAALPDAPPPPEPRLRAMPLADALNPPAP